MRKLSVPVAMAMAVVAIGVVSLGVALAQGPKGDGSVAGSLAARVAEILGLDAAEVGDAISQARTELRDEAVQEKLTALVEKGLITQEQADEKSSWFQSKPEWNPANGKQFFGKMEHHGGWKGHNRFFGSRHHFKGKPSWGSVEKKFDAMVESGDITQEEADAKLEALQAKIAEKTASP